MAGPLYEIWWPDDAFVQVLVDLDDADGVTEVTCEGEPERASILATALELAMGASHRDFHAILYRTAFEHGASMCGLAPVEPDDSILGEGPVDAVGVLADPG